MFFLSESVILTASGKGIPLNFSGTSGKTVRTSITVAKFWLAPVSSVLGSVAFSGACSVISSPDSAVSSVVAAVASGTGSSFSQTVRSIFAISLGPKSCGVIFRQE